MSARNSAKAIIINNDRILVNRCISRFGEYYSLPGGGQRDGEILTDTVRREVYEETGYTVTPLRMAGIYERVSDARNDGMSHKIYFIFNCRLNSGECNTPTETDRFQAGACWIPLRDIATANLFPRAIRDNIPHMIGYGETIFIGSERER